MSINLTISISYSCSPSHPTNFPILHKESECDCFFFCFLQAPCHRSSSPFVGSPPRMDHETPRGFMRRQRITQTVLLSPVHKSISLEDSRDWYAREVQEQLSRGELFNDPFMPAADSTIKKSFTSQNSQYEWLRPHVSKKLRMSQISVTKCL